MGMAAIWGSYQGCLTLMLVVCSQARMVAEMAKALLMVGLAMKIWRAWLGLTVAVAVTEKADVEATTSVLPRATKAMVSMAKDVVGKEEKQEEELAEKVMMTLV